MTVYTSVTDADRAEMLATIGVDSIDALFADIPEPLRLGRPLDIPAGLSEQAVYRELATLASRNVSAEDEVSFLGAGMYDAYVPAIVDSIISRSEFLTPYTPYQPEISQGGLQAMFEYQTAISELVGLPVSNASVYEGPSAVAAAVYVAKHATGRHKFVVSTGVHPHSIETIGTVAKGYGMDGVIVGLNDAGITPLDNEAPGVLDEDTACVVVQQPNFFGCVEDIADLAARAHAVGALLIVAADPIPLALVEAPGKLGADIVVGEGQTLGNRLDFGGPSFGFFAVTEALIRRLPGRLVGETRDLEGKRGFVLTLQTREQHIRRDKATSNICTAQALNALAGVIYLSWLGRQGIVELAELLLQRTAYARAQLTAIDGVNLRFSAPVIREFALTIEGDLDAVIAHCRAAGINPGYRVDAHTLLVAITELRTREHIDALVSAITEALA